MPKINKRTVGKTPRNGSGTGPARPAGQKTTRTAQDATTEATKQPRTAQRTPSGHGARESQGEATTNGTVQKTTTVQNGSAQTNTKERVRRVGWSWRHPMLPYGVLHIEDDKGRTEYFLEHHATVVFVLNKLEPSRCTRYTVLIGSVKHCGCDGFRRHQHCKHIEALVKFKTAGKL